jgi:hypothetical protein
MYYSKLFIFSIFTWRRNSACCIRANTIFALSNLHHRHHRTSCSHLPPRLHFHKKPWEISSRSEWICALRRYSIINDSLRKKLLNLEETISIRACSQFPHFLYSISFFISFLLRLHSRHRPGFPD